MSVTTSTFSLPGSIPSPVILCPKNISSDLLNRHFALFNFKPCFLTDSKTSNVLFCNSSRVSPYIIISSLIFVVLSMFSNIWVILFWHTSLAE